jgi:hypothetical protein
MFLYHVVKSGASSRGCTERERDRGGRISRHIFRHTDARGTASGYGTRMSTYTIIARTDQVGFSVGVVGDDGARQTILGFKTEADARAWIAQDERLNNAANPFLPPSRRPGRS